MADATPEKPHLLLLPGMMCDHRLWDLMVPKLRRHAEPVFGDLSKGATIPEMAAQVLADAPASFHLCGFSMGGFVAREIALTQPERVRSLVLINTSARGTTASDISRRQDMIRMLADRPYNGVTRSNLTRSVHETRAADTALLDRIQEMALGLGKDVFLRQLALVRDDGHLELADIACPALVLFARHDRLRSLDESRALADGIPGAQFRIIEDGGHMTPLEHPDILGDILTEWIDECQASASRP